MGGNITEMVSFRKSQSNMAPESSRVAISVASRRFQLPPRCGDVFHVFRFIKLMMGAQNGQEWSVFVALGVVSLESKCIYIFFK